MNILWFLAGAALELLNLAGQWWSVSQVGPNSSNHAGFWILGGAGFRLLIIVIVLFLALQESAAAAIFAVTGLWLARTVSLFWLETKDWRLK